MVIRRLTPVTRHILFAAAYAVLGIVLGAITVLVLTTKSGPELETWHLANFNSEYSARKNKSVQTLEQYQQLEEELFRELDDEVYAKGSEATQTRINRFNRGSWVDPTNYPVNWNRTIELTANKPRAGYLLLHGLSDSPYSLRTLAKKLNSRQGWVVSLRVPGHGTAPSGLLRTKWTDFTSAVRIAARHLREKIGPDAPLYLVGYSNGAALALEYTLAELEGESLPKPAGLVLISPAVGVSSLAALAPWKRRLSYLPGLHKLAWISIQPEYDPYKYNSFPLNAAEQIYYLTQDIARRIDRLDQGEGIKNFPPVLAFTSVVDSTVPVNALVDALFLRLAPNNHRLVVYGVNREANTRSLLTVNPIKSAEILLSQEVPFDLLLLTNESANSVRLVQKIKRANTTNVSDVVTRLRWPEGIYSLSHVALPFAPDDPVYGDVRTSVGDGVSLGNIQLRGEQGVLLVPARQLIRLRYNPFYRFQETQILNWLNSIPAEQAG
jgi:alpha-beta hydrolase superfamily lysophospholipase